MECTSRFISQQELNASTQSSWHTGQKKATSPQIALLSSNFSKCKNSCGSRCRLIKKKNVCIRDCIQNAFESGKFLQSWRSRSSDGYWRHNGRHVGTSPTGLMWTGATIKRPHINSFEEPLRPTVCLRCAGLERESRRTYRRISLPALLVGWHNKHNILTGGGWWFFCSQHFINFKFKDVLLLK